VCLRRFRADVASRCAQHGMAAGPPACPRRQLSLDPLGPGCTFHCPSRRAEPGEHGGSVTAEGVLRPAPDADGLSCTSLCSRSREDRCRSRSGMLSAAMESAGRPSSLRRSVAPSRRQHRSGATTTPASLARRRPGALPRHDLCGGHAERLRAPRLAADRPPRRNGARGPGSAPAAADPMAAAPARSAGGAASPPLGPSRRRRRGWSGSSPPW
jgi:hypothetical protein